MGVGLLVGDWGFFVGDCVGFTVANVGDLVVGAATGAGVTAGCAVVGDRLVGALVIIVGDDEVGDFVVGDAVITVGEAVPVGAVGVFVNRVGDRVVGKPDGLSVGCLDGRNVGLRVGCEVVGVLLGRNVCPG